MNSMIVCFLTCGIFFGLAVVAHREMKQIPEYSLSDRAGMDRLIEQVTVLEVHKIRPVSKMPPKKGLHWVSLAKAAAQTGGEDFNGYLEMAGKGIVR